MENEKIQKTIIEKQENKKIVRAKDGDNEKND